VGRPASDDERDGAIEAVCFDAAGTLIRVRGGVGQQYATVARRFGIAVDPAALDAGFAAAFRSAPPMAFPDAPPADVPARERAVWRDLVGRLFAGAGCREATETPIFERYFEELYAHFATPAAWDVFPDVRPALDAVRARGCCTALVTNFDGRIAPLLEALGLRPAFDVVTRSSEVGAAKPDRRIFEAALGALGVAAGSVLHVGDSRREDLEGARAAGLRGLVIDRGGRHLDLPAELRIASLVEIAPRLSPS
jgi:putative hydrolase of the HAD superfamily